jgi:hypothetical protein
MMSRKSFAVKSLVYLTFLLSLSGVIFCVVYQARHPTSNYIEPKRQTENKPEQGGDKIAAIQQASTKPDYQTTQNEQSYDSKWSDPIVILTALLVAGVFVTNCIYYGQLKKMRETVALLVGEGTTMRKQLAAMEWQAGILEVQAGLFDKQVKAMQDQMALMERQERFTRDALIISNSAVVAVHSIEMNKARKTVLVRIENTGNRPAEHISLFLQVFTFMPPKIGKRDEPITQETKDDFVREDYGRTKLFKGNLPILITFYLSRWSDEEFELIQKGICGLTVDGYVKYSDGFSSQPTERTEFFFTYLPEIDAWSAGPADYGDILGRDKDEESEQAN